MFQLKLICFFQQTLLLSLRNKFKKERKPLTDLEVVKQHKMKFGAHGRGRKRKDDEVTDDNVSATAAKQIRVGVSSCKNSLHWCAKWATCILFAVTVLL